jgi:hypothetical protein
MIGGINISDTRHWDEICGWPSIKQGTATSLMLRNLLPRENAWPSPCA